MSTEDLLRVIRRNLRLSSMHQVLRELRKRNVRLKDLHALEIFGGSGGFHTKDYATHVSTLDIWEIEPKYEGILRQNFPLAEVMLTNSYKEIENTHKKYSLIIVDNPMSTLGDYCEHFDLFPAIFRVAMDSTVLILNVIPEISDASLKKFPYLFNPSQLERRRSFYQTNHPEKVSFEEMVEVYRNLTTTNNFNLEWYFFQKRSVVYYFVLKIKRSEG